MSNGNGHHWSKFAWRDWSGDKALHSCTIAARGFWVEVLCIMHEGDPVGHLTMNGRPATLRQIASSANVTEKEALKLLAELEEAGVFSRTPDGTIYCRRMVRDTAASEVGRTNAVKRWNATHPNGAPNGGAMHKPNGVANGEASGEANGAPNAKNLESESELEERPSRSPPTADAAGGLPAADAAGPLTRTRANGQNPRVQGTNPRAAARRAGGFVSGGIAVLAERLLQVAAANQPQHPDDDLTDERSYFPGLKVVEGGRG
jgi:hypothetical protein